MLIPTLLIGLVVLVTFAVAYRRHRDTFHPALLIAPMLAFLYWYSPLTLEAKDGFYGFLWDDHVTRAQWVHLVGIVAMCLGLLVGGGGSAAKRPDAAWGFDDRTLFLGAIVLGTAGVAAFLYGVSNVGGFGEAYGRGYGGGYAESGWLRDMALLPLPALLLMTLSHKDRPVTARDLLWLLFFASPFLIHGLLGARRGPTFMAMTGLAMVLYMVRDRRPRLITLLTGGALLGTFMLVLVQNRDAVYLGTDEEFESSPDWYFQPGPGNDFIYGAGLVIVTDETQDFDWGASYAVTLFVRPIPRAIWPTKYEDAARFFGRPSLEENLGVDITSFRTILGWTAARGAAPGIVGDMWREFSWGMVFALFGLGWFYAYAWHRAVTSRGMWMPVYCLLASLSIYMVMQTLEAVLSRFLFNVVPMLIVMHIARRASRHEAAAVPGSELSLHAGPT